MKQLFLILLTFIIAFATSLLFDLPFVANNQVRYILVILLIIIEIVVGFNAVKTTTIKK